MDEASIKELLTNSTILYFIAHGFLALWGLVDCFWGFKLFKATLSFFGFLLGAAVGAQLAKILIPGEIGYLIGASLAGALIGALVSYKLYRVGLFCLGAWLGVVLLLPLVTPYSLVIQYVSLAVAATITGLLTVYILTYMIVITTAITGAFRLVFGVAFFTNGPNLIKMAQMNEPITLSYTDPLVLISLGIGLLGLFVQKGAVKKAN